MANSNPVGEAKKKYDNIKNLPFFIGLWVVGVPIVLSALTAISGLIFTNNDWRWWFVIIGGAAALVGLILLRFAFNPIFLLIFIIGIALELIFFIWVVVEKSTEVYNSASTYAGEIGQSISNNPTASQIKENVTQGQEAAGEQVDVGIGVWDKVLVFFDQLKGLGLNI